MGVIDYKDICRMLKRYSFDEKIRICNHYSRMLLDVNGDVSVEKMTKYSIYPWELETFLLLAIKATPEYKFDNFQGKNINKFLGMVSGIREFVHPEIEKLGENIKFADYFMVATGLIQFDIQEAKHYKMYRYSYIFNFCNDVIDMKQIFKEFFGVEYKEFLRLGSFMLLLFGSGFNFNVEILNYLVKNVFQIPFNQLLISLDEYKEQLNSIATDFNDYVTCLRPSYKYPFIVKDECFYVPLPHTIGRAVTSSLLYRLTEGNNDLRSIIGKEILERYLVKILSESEVYEEIYPECEFEKEHHNRAKTLDVMMRVNDDYLFMDSKTAVPLIGLRLFDEESHKKEIVRLTENIVQVYRHLREFLPKFKTYNPFKGNPHIDIDNLWGVIVVLEDSYIRRNIIYEHAAEKLCIEKDSNDYSWMTEHIKITNLYDVERFALSGRSIVDDLRRQKQHGNSGDYALLGVGQINNKSKDYIEFINELRSDFQDIANKLIEAGIVLQNIE